MFHVYNWLLIIVAILAVFAVYGLMGIIDGAIRTWAAIKQNKLERRYALRRNINALIVSIAESGEGVDCTLLDRALQDSIVEYRII